MTQPFGSPVRCYDGWWLLTCVGGAAQQHPNDVSLSDLDGCPFIDHTQD